MVTFYKETFMKKYFFCLFVLPVLFCLSCATAPDTPAPAAQSGAAQQPAATPPPSTAATPAATPASPSAPLVLASSTGLDMSGAANYTVVFGDFLSEITRTFYGNFTDVGPAGKRNGFYFPLLMLASEGQINDPDLIFPGMILKIPDLRRNLANPDSRRAIKNILAQTAILYGNKRLQDEAEGLRRLADSL
jgi:LysM repeat protein